MPKPQHFCLAEPLNFEISAFLVALATNIKHYWTERDQKFLVRLKIQESNSFCYVTLLITTSVNDTQKPTNTATFTVRSVLHQIISAAVFAIQVLRVRHRTISERYMVQVEDWVAFCGKPVQLLLSSI